MNGAMLAVSTGQKNGPGKLVQTGAAKSRDEVSFANRGRAKLTASQWTIGDLVDSLRAA